jgi:hypothetical protein
MIFDILFFQLSICHFIIYMFFIKLFYLQVSVAMCMSYIQASVEFVIIIDLPNNKPSTPVNKIVL